MSRQPDRLYDLLPAVYRLRDGQNGEPLRALLQVIAEQVGVVQADIERLYDNWFIETCEDWVVPYLGDLVGELPLAPLAALQGPSADNARRRFRTVAPRRQVAGAIGRRRRKGTPSVLEELAAGISGWPARVVESFRLLLLWQATKHLHLERGRTVDVREVESLERLDGPFDDVAHVVDVRRVVSRRSPSRWNIPEVAVFAWRLRPHSRTMAQAFCIDRARHRYLFSVLGNDAPLMAAALPEPDATHVAQEENLPAFISRRALHERAAELYGPGRSLRVWRNGLDHPVPVHDIVSADLSTWEYRPHPNEVAVDPELGRIAFSPRNEPEDGVWVTFSEGFPDDLGGGEYPRALSASGARSYYPVSVGGTYSRVMDAIAAIGAERDASDGPVDALIEIVDGEVYQERIDIELRPGDRLELRAAEGKRPVIRLLDLYANRPDQMRVRGVAGDVDPGDAPCPPPAPRLVLDGLLIEGRSLQLVGPIGEVCIRHCTLVPGWSLEHDCRPTHESEPSIELDDTSACLCIENSVVGSILVDVSEVTADPVAISLTDSVLDSTSDDADALYGPDGHAHAVLSAVRSTVFGSIVTHAILLASNSIFTGRIAVARRQIGCLRYCSVPVGSRTPRRHRCQPDLVRAAAKERAAEWGLTDAVRDELCSSESVRVAPAFDSVRYGMPSYARLAPICATEISRGADDGSELGVYHDLFNPQREDALRRALADFTPAGMGAGVIFAT